MTVRAAVLPAGGAPLVVPGIDRPAPAPGRVRVRLAAAGVCHSDLSLSDGTMRLPVPAVLGHEGAGTVVEVGDGVTHVAPGDGVVLNWAPSCGACPACARGEVWLCANALAGAAEVHARRADDGTDLYPGLNVAAFAEETVVPASCVLPAPEGVPLTDANLRAAESDTAGAVNIGRGVETNVLEIVEVLGGHADGAFEPEHAPERPGEVQRIALDAARARSELGWQAEVGLEDGLERTLASLR